ncbi:MAG: ExbD/TolR family protein [Deltaproteobacteria bacterium]
MRFRRNLRYENVLSPVYLVPAVTLAFILALIGALGPQLCRLPGAQVKQPVSPLILSDRQTLQIVLSADSSFSVNGAAVTKEQLAGLLRAVSFRDPQVLIKASSKAPIEAAMDLWRLCGQSKIQKVSLVTD